MAALPTPRVEETSTVSKSRLLEDYRDDQVRADIGSQKPAGPTLALRLAASLFGGRPREHYVPIGVLAERNLQVFSGFPVNPASWIFRVTGETTSRGIAEALYPNYQDTRLPPEKRLELRAGLPRQAEAWLRSIPGIVTKVREGRMDCSPVILLEGRGHKDLPRFFIVENLSGQVPDGSHRMLAFALLAPENPDARVRVKTVTIHPLVLALVNCLTSALYFLMNPFRAPGFLRKRFSGTAPLEFPEDADGEEPEGC